MYRSQTGPIHSPRNMLQCVAVCCSVLQCVAVCYSVLQCVAATLPIIQHDIDKPICGALQLQCAAHCNTLQHTATHCNTLQHAKLSNGCSTAIGQQNIDKQICCSYYTMNSHYTILKSPHTIAIIQWIPLIQNNSHYIISSQYTIAIIQWIALIQQWIAALQ